MAKKTEKTEPTPKTIKMNYTRGALYALGGPIVGIILWVLLWEAGFIASIATFVMAWLTVWLYQKGAGGVDQKSLYVILPYIVVGLVLSFLSGVIDDGLKYVIESAEEVQGMGKWALLQNTVFWQFMGENLASAELWKSYTTDILISLGLGVLGVYSTVKNVLLYGRAQAPTTK